MLKINHPLVRRASRWIQDHPLVAVVLVVLGFLLKDFPQWLSSVWALRSSRPLTVSLAEKMQNLQLPHFSIYWLTTPLGWGLLIAIFYLLLTGRRNLKSGAALVNENNSTTQVKGRIVEGSVNFTSCSDDWLHRIAQYEKTAIDKRIKISGCRIQNTLFNETPTEILFYVEILNSSVYPIVLEEATNPGRIKHVRKPLLYPPAIEETDWECQRASAQSFFIRQQLTDGEVTRIRDSEQGTFQFDALVVMIKGGKGYEDIVEPRPLIIPYWLGIDNKLNPHRR